MNNFQISILFVSEAVQEYNIKFACNLMTTVKYLFNLAYVETQFQSNENILVSSIVSYRQSTNVD